MWCEASYSRGRARGLDRRNGAGHEGERTLNISSMSVTREVSKLSDWLNADAPCRESKGGHTVRDDVRAGRRKAGTWRRAIAGHAT